MGIKISVHYDNSKLSCNHFLYILFIISYIGFALKPYTYIHQVWSGDAMANQLMQLIMQVVRNLKRDSNPPILLLLPLGSKANISFSLGWVS